MQEARVGSLAWEDAPGGGDGNTFQYSCLGEFHGQDKPGGLQAMRLKRVRYDWAHALKTLICSRREYIMMLTLWKSLAVSLIKHLCVLWPGGNLLGICSRDWECYIHTKTHMWTFAVLNWPKSSFGFSVTSYGKTWVNFLANQIALLIITKNRKEVKLLLVE